MLKPTLGSGKRFATLKAKIAAKGGVRDPGAVAAAIGRKKYGKAKFQQLAARGHMPKGATLSPKGDIGARRIKEAEAAFPSLKY